MASVSTYLNFPGKTEEAFALYKKVFGTEFSAPIMRMGDVPEGPGGPPLQPHEKNYVMHVELPILAGHKLHGTDAIAAMGVPVVGKNVSINLDPDSREDADRLFKELSEGGEVGMPMTDMFWGAYWGSFTDRFGIQWMINYVAAK